MRFSDLICEIIHLFFLLLKKKKNRCYVINYESDDMEERRMKIYIYKKINIYICLSVVYVLAYPILANI